MAKKTIPLLSPLLKQLHRLLWIAFIFLSLGGFYLAIITFSEWLSDTILQGVFYQWMFVSHLLMGLVVIIPGVYFIADHLRRGWRRPNRNAVYLGLGLASTVLLIFITGVLLIRFDGFPDINGSPRQLNYWLHILLPIAIILLYRYHRKLGRPMDVEHFHFRLKLAAGVILLIVVTHFVQNRLEQTDFVKIYQPSLVEVPKNASITSQDLLIDDYCEGCHKDIVERWQHSAHHLSSLNNPVYNFSVINTKKALTSTKQRIRFVEK